MSVPSCLKKATVFILVCSALLTFTVSGRAEKHISPQEEAMGYFRYEAVFLDREEVEEIFQTVSDQYPLYEYTPDHFHVTTQFRPETEHEELYGLPVTVHIIGYAKGSVQDTQEGVTSDNEGLLVEISSTDERLQDLIDSIDRVWHITGSYSGAAMYSKQLDFSHAIPIDITITGIFGMGDSNEAVRLDQQDEANPSADNGQ